MFFFPFLNTEISIYTKTKLMKLVYRKVSSRKWDIGIQLLLTRYKYLNFFLNCVSLFYIFHSYMIFLLLYIEIYFISVCMKICRMSTWIGITVYCLLFIAIDCPAVHSFTCHATWPVYYTFECNQILCCWL